PTITLDALGTGAVLLSYQPCGRSAAELRLGKDAVTVSLPPDGAICRAYQQRRTVAGLIDAYQVAPERPGWYRAVARIDGTDIYVVEHDAGAQRQTMLGEKIAHVRRLRAKLTTLNVECDGWEMHLLEEQIDTLQQE